MNQLIKTALALLGVFLMSATSNALTITPATTPQWTGNNTSNLGEAELEAFLLTQGVTADLSLLYKKDVGPGPDTGPFSGSYKTTFSNTSDDPEDALVDYQSGPAISGSIYLYVKDGEHSPAFYLFLITGWNGTDDLVLDGFWPNQGAISNIAIYGSNGTQVPDGGTTALLLGLGLSGIGWAQSRLGSRKGTARG